MRVLVTVASRHGGTQEIGAAVARVLREAGHEVTEVDPDEVRALDVYDAVVLGSAVYAGRLAAALRELVDRLAGQLTALPVWLFWSGPVGVPPLPATEPDDVRVVARRVGAREVRCFGGRLRRGGGGGGAAPPPPPPPPPGGGGGARPPRAPAAPVRLRGGVPGAGRAGAGAAGARRTAAAAGADPLR
ncbi:flavodoxin domain-containing protein, partial [Cellulomonas hominis]|uniref:flavodoxin domain-containing protein n=1 Tax=Cellulomonas hominis TaxID=156981 RepID=UPI001BCD953D